MERKMRARYLLPHKLSIFFSLIVLLIILFPLLVHVSLSPIEFNQFWIQQLHLTSGIMTREMFLDAAQSSYSSGMNILSGNAITEEPNFNDSQAMLRYIWSWVPTYTVTYPTERFFYWSTVFDDVGRVSGNIRAADLDKGQLYFAYFTVPEKDTRLFIATEEHGLEINKIHDYLYDVTFNGKTVRMKFPYEDLFPPKRFTTLAVEEFVGQIHDESGVKLVMFFNHNTSSFYNVLNEEDGLTESLLPLDEQFVIGSRSGFVYYVDDDYNRKIMVGLFIENSWANNYFDGPGDQVPIRAFIREKLRKAYPGTQRGAGTDFHGVYNNATEWMRVAISPYRKYSDPSEIPWETKHCQNETMKSELWTCLTQEWWRSESYG